MDLRLEVLVVPVSDVDRAKEFYKKLGWRLDIDLVGNENLRVIQFTPPGSQASIIFGKGVTSARPGSIDRMVLAVDDIDAARAELRAHGARVSEVFHDAGGGPGGGFIADAAAHATGPDPQRRSYASYATFSDPDGNVWMLQELKTRLPGREWETEKRVTDAATLAGLLKETSEHHDHYEKTHAKHQWWDWYAPYLSARQKGGSPAEATAAADRHMEDVLQAVPR